MPCPWWTTESRIAAWGATASAHRPREVKPVQSPRKSASRSLASCQRLTRQTSTVFSRTDFRTVQVRNSRFQAVLTAFPHCLNHSSSRLPTPVQRSVTEEFTEGNRATPSTFGFRSTCAPSAVAGYAPRCLPGNTIWYPACCCAGCSVGDRPQESGQVFTMQPPWPRKGGV
jgi:hypothetical protein